MHYMPACFTRLEELCNTLQLMRDRLERMWTEKGGRLDQILQLRVYENDTEQVCEVCWCGGVCVRCVGVVVGV